MVEVRTMSTELKCPHGASLSFLQRSADRPGDGNGCTQCQRRALAQLAICFGFGHDPDIAVRRQFQDPEGGAISVAPCVRCGALVEVYSSWRGVS